MWWSFPLVPSVLPPHIRVWLFSSFRTIWFPKFQIFLFLSSLNWSEAAHFWQLYKRSEGVNFLSPCVLKNVFILCLLFIDSLAGFRTQGRNNFPSYFLKYYSIILQLPGMPPRILLLGHPFLVLPCALLSDSFQDLFFVPIMAEISP